LAAARFLAAFFSARIPAGVSAAARRLPVASISTDATIPDTASFDKRIS
jgi:hypothetical protein